MVEITCPERLDSDAANALFDQINAHVGEDLEVDLGAVTFLGAMCVQTLRTAAAQWASDGAKFRILNLSVATAEDLRLLGASSMREVA